MNYQKFPFGKYKGSYLHDIPSTYLCYALEEFTLPDELAEALKQQLQQRFSLIEFVSTGISKADLSKVYKQMAKKYHPDKGGSNEAMTALNEMYNELSNYAL